MEASESKGGSKNLRGHDPRKKKNRGEYAFGRACLLERFLDSKAAAYVLKIEWGKKKTKSRTWQPEV